MSVPVFSQGIAGIGTVGKTYYAVSSFWDISHQKAIRRGKWITIGREGNPFLGVPEEARQLNRMSLRLRSPALDDMNWLNTLEEVLKGLLKEARIGNRLDVLVFDGITELNHLHEETFRRTNDPKDRFAPFNQWQRDLLALLQRLDPQELGCYVLVTSRVGERKDPILSKEGKVISPGEDETLLGGFDYYPLVRGGFKYQVPNYFDFFSFMDVEHGERAVARGVSEIEARHRLFVLPGQGGFYVHNKAEHLWLANKCKPVLVNPTFDDFLREVEKAMGKGLTQGIEESRVEVPAP